MPKRLVPLTIGAPGFFGLNTQNSGAVLPPGWATRAINCVYDDSGRLASRKGSKQINPTVITNTPTVRALHEYVDGSGNTVNIVATDNKIYKEVSGTMTDISGTITTPTADDWQFVNFNGWCVGFQENHAPIVATSATSPSFANSGGTQFNGVAVEAAFGRLWTVLGSTLYYSDLLINNFTGGSSGTFDLSKYWPSGMDEPVAVKEFNGLLLVFGKRSIIIYENPDDVSVMGTREGIANIGCPYRDTIVAIGDDLVFLSSTGLRSLKRALVDENLPLTDLSRHVRDQMLNELQSETAVRIKAAYSESEGFYLLSFPLIGKSYYFDRKFPNEDGTWRATSWDVAPTALSYTINGQFQMAVEDGYISRYTGYLDGVASDSTGGSTYTMDYIGVWNDFGEDVAVLYKIPKQVSVLASGTVTSDITFKWAVDYEPSFTTRALSYSGVSPVKYGEGTWGVSVYGSSKDFERVKAAMSRYGQVLKVGLTVIINGDIFALQRIDVMAKVGRIGI